MRACTEVEAPPAAWAPKGPLVVGTGRDWPFTTAVAALNAPPRTHEDDEGFLDLNAGEGMTWDAALGLAADVTGIFDPTPVSDGVSALQSLAHGDFYGVALSAGSAVVPFAGDAVAKPIKFAARLLEAFPSLKALASEPRVLGRLVDILGSSAVNPKVLNETFRSLARLAADGAAAFEKHPDWLARVERLQLPTKGPVTFVPPPRWTPSSPLRSPDRQGFVDAYENVWRKGPSRTPGEPFEWDVTPKRVSGLTYLAHGGTHVNVSLTGMVTH